MSALSAVRVKRLALWAEKCRSTTDNSSANGFFAPFTFFAGPIVDIEVDLEVTGVATGTKKIGNGRASVLNGLFEYSASR